MPGWPPGDVLQVLAAFPVRLVDHNVALPPLAVGKVAETVRVSVTVLARSGSQRRAIVPGVSNHQAPGALPVTQHP